VTEERRERIGCANCNVFFRVLYESLRACAKIQAKGERKTSSDFNESVYQVRGYIGSIERPSLSSRNIHTSLTITL